MLLFRFQKVPTDHPFSARYTAPEVGTTGQMTVQAEVYAFGLMIYEVLKKEKPFQLLNAESVWKKIRADPTMRPMIHTFPPEQKKLMEQCWHVNPATRPNMDAVCKSLYGLVNGEKFPASLAVPTQKTTSQMAVLEKKPVSTPKKASPEDKKEGK